MQELAFEQVGVVVGGSGGEGADTGDNGGVETDTIKVKVDATGSSFVGSTTHKYLLAAASSALVTGTAALFKCTATGPAYALCVGGSALGGAVGGIAAQAAADFL